MRRSASTKKSYQGEDMLSSVLLSSVLFGNRICSFSVILILVELESVLASVLCHIISNCQALSQKGSEDFMSMSN